MSYRSDVRFRLLKEDYKELEDAYITELGHNPFYIEFWQNKNIYKDEGDTIYFGWNDTKWYRFDRQDFAYVDFIMSFATNLRQYAYAIIGENLEDIDVDCNGEIDCISVARSFEDDTRI